MQYIWVNGADQGQNVDIRVPPNNNPVTDVTSTDITCNVNGLSGAGVSTATIPAGATVSFFTLPQHFLCSLTTLSHRLPSNGTNMPSARVKTRSPVDTRVLFRSISRRRLRPPHHSTDRAPCGPRSILLASLTLQRKSGLPMSSMPLAASIA